MAKADARTGKTRESDWDAIIIGSGMGGMSAAAALSRTGHKCCCSRGAFYGLDVTPERMLSDALGAKSPVAGLYLSGQDVASPGIPGAMWGGVLCAGSIDPAVFRHMR